jgi:hypothetical protein
MLSWNVTPDPPRIIGPWFLWKLLIDERHQRRGYGRDAVTLVADIVRANGAAELLTSCVPADDGPEPFYRRIGFTPTGHFSPRCDRQHSFIEIKADNLTFMPHPATGLACEDACSAANVEDSVTRPDSSGVSNRASPSAKDRRDETGLVDLGSLR